MAEMMTSFALVRVPELYGRDVSGILFQDGSDEPLMLSW